MDNKIFLSSPHMSDEGYEQSYIEQAFKTNWIAPLGVNVDKFEEELSDYVGISSAAALSSGTAALHLALKAVGVGKDDIVFCQTLTFSATVNPIIYQGAKPVFIDSDYETWNMDPVSLRRGLEKYPNAKAVIVVHLYGLAANLDEILLICNEFNIPLIEDAAESLGSTYKGRQTGTFGNVGIFSFNGNKIITTSGGGMLVSNNEKLVEKTRFWATQSRDKARHYQHSEIGYNYRMSNICAGIGRGQLEVLDERIKKKNEIYNFYKRELTGIGGMSFMPNNDWCQPNFWLSVIQLESKTPEELIIALEKENIESRPVWKPMHLQPIFEKYDYVGEDIAESLFNKGVCLPSDTKMTDYEMEKVVRAIKRVFKDEY